MAFTYQGLLSQKKKPNRFISDPSKLTTTTAQRQPSYTYDYQAGQGGATTIRRQTTAQANRPSMPTSTPGPGWGRGDRVMPSGARMFNMAVKPAGFDPTASQFPWQMRRGISSDASRQRAFRFGFGSGEGRTGFARKATDTFFDPRYMYDRNFQRWALQQRLRRRYEL